MTRLAAAAVLIALVAPAAARDVIEIHLRGRYYAEPATVQITVAVEPDDENRLLIIEADGERFYRASELELDGEHDKRLHSVTYRNLPAGHYVLRAEVRSTGGIRGRATEELVVTGIGGR